MQAEKRARIGATFFLSLLGIFDSVFFPSKVENERSFGLGILK